MAADVVYETDEKGQRSVVKSLESNSIAYLRFTNKTSRPVDIWWRDFQGAKKHYSRVDPGMYFDVHSYITHPWEFTDVATKENYLINNKPIFRPPANIDGTTHRTNWDITTGVQSLRDTVPSPHKCCECPCITRNCCSGQGAPAAEHRRKEVTNVDVLVPNFVLR